LAGDDANVNEAFEDWRHIIEALENRDSSKAKAITQDHISRYAQRIKKRLPRRRCDRYEPNRPIMLLTKSLSPSLAAQ